MPNPYQQLARERKARKTEAKVWAIVLEDGNLVVCISVARLFELAKAAYDRRGAVEMNRSANPTRGVLIPLGDLVRAGTKAMRATLAGEYAT